MPGGEVKSFPVDVPPMQIARTAGVDQAARRIARGLHRQCKLRHLFDAARTQSFNAAQLSRVTPMAMVGARACRATRWSVRNNSARSPAASSEAIFERSSRTNSRGGVSAAPTGPNEWQINSRNPLGDQ